MIAVLVLLAMAGSGAIVYGIEHERNRAEAREEVNQEFQEFVALQENGIDPATGDAFAGVVPLLETFLDRNVPSPSEAFFAWFDGEPLPGQGEEYLAESEFRAIVAELIPVDGDQFWYSPVEDEEVLIAVQTVQFAGDERVGAIVVVQELGDRDALLQATMRTYLIAGLLSLLLILVIAWWQAGRLLSPLRTMRVTAERMSATDLSQRLPVSGNDDITALTRTINSMLDRLEAAFTSQKQFLDDAGHEIRTPLTVVSGHLELLDVTDPDEVESTRVLLLDEVERMARLTRDLILLAKSDRPDFLHFEPVDLQTLVDDVFAKARALGEREWRHSGAPTASVEMDRHRITQALLQLVDNAVKHTRSGDTIDIGASLAGGHVRIWVGDSGPGVPAADRERIFERFGRAAVAENDEGFGLGLSIVRAIVAGHGGAVRVEESAFGGACFVLSLRTRQTEKSRTQPWPGS